VNQIAPWAIASKPEWRRLRIRRVGSTASGSGFPPILQGRTGLELPFYKVKHLGQADSLGRLAEPDDSIDFETAAELGATVFPAGTLVYAKVGAALMLGRVRTLPQPACLDNNMAGLIPNPAIDSRFLFWAMSQIKFDYLVNPGAVPSLSDRNLLDYPLLVPSVPEQRAIADFLDRETARIDTLIEEQQRLIEMLRERRAGVIAEAVTRGIDVGVPASTKIEWLGPTPTHWRVGKVKHCGDVTLGKMLQSVDSGSDVYAPYLRAANVQPDGALHEDDVKEMWFSVAELASLNLLRGDVVVVEGGVGGYGRAAYLDHDLDGWGFQNSINRIRPHEGADGRYIAYFLIMARAKGFIEAYCNVVSMPHLTAEKLNSLRMPIPTLDEQQRIANYLDEQTFKIDRLIAETEQFIQLARERRAALITAAVTAQIDVQRAA